MMMEDAIALRDKLKAQLATMEELIEICARNGWREMTPKEKRSAYYRQWRANLPPEKKAIIMERNRRNAKASEARRLAAKLGVEV